MIQLFKNKEEKESFISSFKNPFNVDNVTDIRIWIRKNKWTFNRTEYSATIDFESGDTKGSHHIEAKDFPSLVKLVENFIQSL